MLLHGERHDASEKEEYEGFRRLLQVLGPLYQLPGPKHFSQTALALLECLAKLEAALKNAKYFATTTTLSSSRTLGPYLKSYCTLNVHRMEFIWQMLANSLFSGGS